MTPSIGPRDRQCRAAPECPGLSRCRVPSSEAGVCLAQQSAHSPAKKQPSRPTSIFSNHSFHFLSLGSLWSNNTSDLGEHLHDTFIIQMDHLLIQTFSLILTLIQGISLCKFRLWRLCHYCLVDHWWWQLATWQGWHVMMMTVNIWITDHTGAHSVSAHPSAKVTTTSSTCHHTQGSLVSLSLFLPDPFLHSSRLLTLY